MSEESVATALVGPPATAAPALLDATIRAATRFAAGDSGAGGLVSARALALSQGVLRTMILTKVKILTGTVLALAMLAGVGSYVGWGWVVGAEDAPKPGVRATDNAAPSDKGMDDKKAIQGVWQITDFEFNGKGSEAPNEEQLKIVKAAKWVFTDDKVVVRTPVGKGSQDSPASFKLDPSKTPKEIDVTPLDGPSKGKTEGGIYSLDGDVLKLCMPGPEGGPRPTEFAADKGGKNILLTLKRQAPGKEKLKEDKPAADKEAIQGTWQITDFEFKGKGAEAPNEDQLKTIKAAKWVFTADKVVVRTPVGKESKDSPASYKLDPSKTPKEIDVTPLDGPSKGKTEGGIYSMDGDVLKLCMPGPEGGPRPTEFAAHEGAKTVLLTLKRVK